MKPAMNWGIAGIFSILVFSTFLAGCPSKSSPTSPAPTPTSTPTPNVTVIASLSAYNPNFLHFDQNGNLYVACYETSGPCTVIKIASPGGASPVTSLAYGGTAASYLEAAVADRNGNLWLVNEAAQVIEIPNGGGTPVTITTGIYTNSHVYDEAINNAGTTLYMCDYDYGYIFALNLSNPSAGATTIVNGSSVNPGYFSDGMNFDPSGNLFLGGDYYEVGEVTAANLNSSAAPVTIAGTVNGAANGTATGTAKFSTVYGVAADGNSNVYAADSNNYAIRKISGGQVTTLVAPSGSALSPSFSPTSMGSNDYIYGVACDSAGNLYISDFSNGDIYRYQP